MESIMDGMVRQRRGTSLCDLGYCDVGLDDGWQECNSPLAAPGMHYHDEEGYPIVEVSQLDIDGGVCTLTEFNGWVLR